MRFGQIRLGFQFRNPDTILHDNPVIPSVFFSIPPPAHAIPNLLSNPESRASKNREIPDPEKPIGHPN